jgi:predicted nucleic acid-binding protein
VVDIIPASLQSLQKTKILLKKYADFPMNYADATLVCLAMDTGMHNIATFDIKDFSIYSLPGKKKFNIII